MQLQLGEHREQAVKLGISIFDATDVRMPYPQSTSWISIIPRSTSCCVVLAVRISLCFVAVRSHKLAQL